MASEKQRQLFKKVMERVRQMNDDELLARIRSHGHGELGRAFGQEIEDDPNFNNFSFDIPIRYSGESGNLLNKDQFNDVDDQTEAANDGDYSQYDLAA